MVNGLHVAFYYYMFSSVFLNVTYQKRKSETNLFHGNRKEHDHLLSVSLTKFKKTFLYIHLP